MIRSGTRDEKGEIKHSEGLFILLQTRPTPAPQALQRLVFVCPRQLLRGRAQ